MELQVFTNEQFGQVRIIQVNNEPYFSNSDVCKILEIGNPSQALKRLKQDGVISNEVIDSMGRKQDMKFISESNFYKLVFQSKKKEAEVFTDWVTSEILPSIRKHGAYVTDQKAVEITTNPNALAEFLQSITDQVKQLETKNLELVEKNEVLAGELKETKPKAEYYDLMLANKGLIKTSEIAKNYGRSAQSFNKLLHKLKVIYKQGETWLPYAKYQTHNYVQLEPFSFTNKKGLPDVKMLTKWTMKGHIFLYELLKKNGILPLIEQDDVA